MVIPYLVKLNAQIRISHPGAHDIFLCTDIIKNIYHIASICFGKSCNLIDWLLTRQDFPRIEHGQYAFFIALGDKESQNTFN